MTSLPLPLRTPVLFLIFNRSDKTRTVLDRIRQARPATLYIAADGPRPDRPGEAELCARTRQFVLDGIDWPCEIKPLFREKNLGCKLAVSSAITWFFEQAEEGIILEDDCLPDLSFFRFCEELLLKYRSNEQIMMITGDNFQPVKRGTGSYYFSRYVHIWGWATWRRAWQKYDLALKSWPALRDSRRFTSFLSPSIYNKAKMMFDGTFEGKTTTWDTQWLFACWANSGLSILPNINLVTNIDSGGTHMKVYDPYIHLAAKSMSFPLLHPIEIKPDEEADRYTQRYVYFRGWQSALKLIVMYLWRNMSKNPSNLPSAVRSVWDDCIEEIRHRKVQ